MWKISGNSSYGATVASIPDAWSCPLVNVTGDFNTYIAIGIYGYQLANAAKILHDFSGRPTSNSTALVNMLENVFHPINHDFLVEHNGAAIDHYWANWDLANLATMQAIGILSDNRTMYEEAVTYFKTAGKGNGQID